MRIRFTTYAMPGYVPGELADLPADQAQRHLAAGVAVPVAEVTKFETATAPKPPLETATVITTPAAPVAISVNTLNAQS